MYGVRRARRMLWREGFSTALEEAVRWKAEDNRMIRFSANLKSP